MHLKGKLLKNKDKLEVQPQTDIEIGQNVFFDNEENVSMELSLAQAGKLGK